MNVDWKTGLPTKAGEYWFVFSRGVYKNIVAHGKYLPNVNSIYWSGELANIKGFDISHHADFVYPASPI